MKIYRYFAALCLLAAVLVFSACGSGKSPAPAQDQMSLSEPAFFGIFSGGSNNYATAPAAAAPAPSAAPGSGDVNYDQGEAASENRPSKKVKTAQMEMEAKDIDSAVIGLESAVLYYGGYVEGKNVSTSGDYKWASVTLRVPVEYYESLVSDIYGLGEIYEFYDSVMDMSGEYYDIKSWLDLSLAEEARLLALIERTEKIEDIITLEIRLGDVRMDIAMYENNLKSIDRKVSYSTINVNIDEKVSPRIKNIRTSLPDRMIVAFTNSANGIVDFVQNVLVTAAYLSVPLALLAACALIGRKVYKRSNK